jgi:hypothetical protein
MIGGAPMFFTYMLIVAGINVAIHVMIQMYFEGHEAFKD